MAISPIAYNIATSILSINPLVEFSVINDDVDRISWDKGTPIAKADILSKQVELKSEYDSQEYARNRQPEYPPIGDQLDALFHAGAFPVEMAAILQAVKDKYPKV